MEGNGECMFSSFVKQMVFKNEEDAKKYKLCHLRRQAIVHFLHHCSEPEYKDWMMKNVKELYGSEEDNVHFLLKHILNTCLMMTHGGTILCCTWLAVCGGIGSAFCWVNVVLNSGWGMTWNGLNVILGCCTIAIVRQGITVEWKGLMRWELRLTKLNWGRIIVRVRTIGLGLYWMYPGGWWWWMKVSWKIW